MHSRRDSNLGELVDTDHTATPRTTDLRTARLIRALAELVAQHSQRLDDLEEATRRLAPRS